MKKIFTLFAITALVLCSCTEDDSFYPKTVNPGDKIAFGGTLDMKNAGKQTRTVYGDRLEGYTEIKWYQGDQVRIYCTKGVDETSKSVTKCDYTVLDPINSTNNQEDDTNTPPSQAYLTVPCRLLLLSAIVLPASSLGKRPLFTALAIFILAENPPEIYIFEISSKPTPSVFIRDRIAEYTADFAS